MVRRLLAIVLIAAPLLSAADKATDKTLEILRELGGLQDQVKALEKSLDGKLADLGQSGADQARTAAEQAGKAAAALGDRLAKGLQEQQDQQTKTLAAVAGLGSQLQGLASDLSTLRGAMNDLTASVARLSTEIGDLNSTVKAAQTPARPDASSAAANSEVSATDLFNSAENDRLGGKLDLALQEYTEFVSKFGTLPQAADAQYYIGSIHYSNKEWDDAVKAFDVLLQSYPDSKRAPGALYYKGDSLNQAGHKVEADAAWRDLRKRYPADPLAKRSVTVKPPAR